MLWCVRATYRVILRSTFINPEIARIGLNEQEARAQGMTFDLTRYDLSDLDRAIADSATTGFVKVLTVPGKDHIVGVTIVSDRADDLLAEFVPTIKHGLELNKILGTIHIYPRLAEADKYLADAWRKAHEFPRLLRLLDRFHRWRRG